MAEKKIILLAGKGISTNIVFNYLNENFGVTLAIIEQKENLKIFLKRRIKRLGFTTVLGQLMFQILIVKPLHLLSKKRIKNIINKNTLNTKDIPPNKIVSVGSVNSNKTIELVKELKPDLIIVNGTRIISKKFLSTAPCRFINTHAGITPKYRGVHGMYWALVNKDPDNCGVTVHFVDQGIDTGNIICQSRVKAEEKDNFSTYPFLQLAKGLQILHKAIEDHFNDRIRIEKGPVESRLYFHPTITEYIKNRIVRKVK